MKYFWRKIKREKGFTLVEIAVVLIVFLVAFGFSVLYTQTSQVGADLSSQASQFVSHLRVTQSDARSGKDGSSHGIYMKDDHYVIFAGDSYVESAEGNFEIELPAGIRIQNVNLNGGAIEVLFSPPRGETVNFGTLDFVATQTGRSITITVSQIGTVNY